MIPMKRRQFVPDMTTGTFLPPFYDAWKYDRSDQTRIVFWGTCSKEMSRVLRVKESEEKRQELSKLIQDIW